MKTQLFESINNHMYSKEHNIAVHVNIPSSVGIVQCESLASSHLGRCVIYAFRRDWVLQQLCSDRTLTFTFMPLAL